MNIYNWANSMNSKFDELQDSNKIISLPQNGGKSSKKSIKRRKSSKKSVKKRKSSKKSVKRRKSSKIRISRKN